MSQQPLNLSQLHRDDFRVRPAVSFVISTHNRREVLFSTLRRIRASNLPPSFHEVLVVDNASSDGTADALASLFPEIRLFRESANKGPVARNTALANVLGEYVLFLDDDSYPHPLSIERMISHFEADQQLAAAVFDVSLPDGSRESSAFPSVFIGCGTGLRRKALDQVGFLPEDFFMAAEEYDLSLRLLRANWKIKRFEDLQVTHLKTPAARDFSKITHLDVRNNLALIWRYFPRPYALAYARDWLQRYRWLASENGMKRNFRTGLIAGLAKCALEFTQRKPLAPEPFETFSRINTIQKMLSQIAEDLGLTKILFVDLGKNLYPYYLAAQAANLEVVAIADNRLGHLNKKYRGIPLITDENALTLPWEAAIISNTSPVHAAARLKHWRQIDQRPIIDLFESERETRQIPRPMRQAS